MIEQSDFSREQYLYLTTTGRKTGLPREIEIWFVTFDDKFFILAEHRERTQWVKNIRHNPRVRVRIGTRTFDATARILDAERDRATYQRAQQLERDKYGWGAGLPVEIVPDSRDA
ncbi:MAG: nitroreductase family deazaflavin-dependent oxidoreductase [Chloroflexi bacterium]|nr:nitroreductase family deazaflavin-dependent oxidoreductase [Chloroflexota bacterium]